MTDPTPQATVVPPPPPPADPPAGPPRRRGLVAGAVALSVMLVAGAVAFALTQRGGSAEAQPLALRFVPGQSETYEIHTTMDGRISSDVVELGGAIPIDVALTEVVTWKVVSVDDQGLATVEVSVDEASGTVSGFEIPTMGADLPPMELVIAPDGRIVSIGGVPLGGFGEMPGFPAMNQLTPILPDEGAAVAPGDTWTKEFSQEMPFGEGAIEVTATSRYDRIEEVDGREAAVIVTEMMIPMDFSFDVGDLAELGAELGATGPTGIDALGDAAIAYTGQVTLTQTSFVDLGAEELLRSESSGTLDMELESSGIPGFEGTTSFAATFSQELDRR
jgi:hypothetical protein